MMRVNKKVLLLCLIGLLICILPSAQADLGPKPTTDVEIIGLNESYYFDLLAQYDRSAVNVLSNDNFLYAIDPYYYSENYPRVLNGYYDNDGFAAYTLYAGIPHTISQRTDNSNVFHCGYFAPPDIFKVVVVTESKNIIVSSVIEKELFNAYITFDLSDFSYSDYNGTDYNGYKIYQLDAESISEDIPVTDTVLEVIITVIATVGIEFLLLLAFNYRDKKSIKLVIITNIITQLILYISLVLGYLYGNFWGYIGVLLSGEVIVFVFEIVIYMLLLKEHTKLRAFMYAIVANLISLIIGIISTSLFM